MIDHTIRTDEMHFIEKTMEEARAIADLCAMPMSGADEIYLIPGDIVKEALANCNAPAVMVATSGLHYMHVRVPGMRFMLACVLPDDLVWTLQPTFSGITKFIIANADDHRCRLFRISGRFVNDAFTRERL